MLLVACGGTVVTGGCVPPELPPHAAVRSIAMIAACGILRSRAGTDISRIICGRLVTPSTFHRTARYGALCPKHSFACFACFAFNRRPEDRKGPARSVRRDERVHLNHEGDTVR